MAHLVETMAYAGEVPWHGLGKKVLPDLTPAQMLKEAGLDWQVEQVPAFANINGKETSIERDALVRSTDKRILSIISKDWKPVQNFEAFEFFNEFVMAGDMDMHTAGSLKNGNIVWALAKVKDSFTIFGGDRVDSYLLFSNPHEYGKSIDIRFTPIRVVCNNTLTLSLSTKADQMVRINHRRKIDFEMVKETLGIAKQKLHDYEERANFLGSKKYNQENVLEYFRDLFPATAGSAKEKTKELSRPAKMAFEALETQPGAEFAPESWWSAFNAVTFITDHKLGHSQETRLNSAWYGPNRDKKLKALNKAVEYANAA